MSNRISFRQCKVENVVTERLHQLQNDKSQEYRNDNLINQFFCLI